MSLAKREIIIWFTTPKQLRKLADKMEAKMKNATAGDSCTTSTIIDKGLELHISADQEAFYRQQQEDWI